MAGMKPLKPFTAYLAVPQNEFLTLMGVLYWSKESAEFWPRFQSGTPFKKKLIRVKITPYPKK